MPISFEKVSYEYAPHTPFSYQALRGVDLQLAEGRITAIIGATGSGKTTLVQHLNALLIPSEGTVRVMEHEIAAGRRFKDAKKLRQKVGLVFQFPEYQLFEETLIKDVAFGPINFGMDADKAAAVAAQALSTVGIDKADFEKSPRELSGGQKRRVAIAGILAMQPKVLVLDEPTAGLDPQGAAAVMELFRRLNRSQGITVIIVSHDMEYVLDYCDQVVVMSHGQAVIQTDVKGFFESEQYMDQANIDPPAIVRFRQLCAAKGLKLPADALTIDALADQIAKRIGR